MKDDQPPFSAAEASQATSNASPSTGFAGEVGQLDAARAGWPRSGPGRSPARGGCTRRTRRRPSRGTSRRRRGRRRAASCGERRRRRRGSSWCTASRVKAPSRRSTTARKAVEQVAGLRYSRPSSTAATSVSVSLVKVRPSASSSSFSAAKFSMIPLWMRASRPSSPRCGCALRSVGPPWVAQRVWPMPVPPSGSGAPRQVALEHAELARPLVGAERPVVVDDGDAGGVVPAVLQPLQPAEEHLDRVSSVPTYPTIPHMRTDSTGRLGARRETRRPWLAIVRRVGSHRGAPPVTARAPSSSSTARDWAELAPSTPQPLHRTEIVRLARPRRSARHARGERGLPAAQPPPEPLRDGARQLHARTQRLPRHRARRRRRS